MTDPIQKADNGTKNALILIVAGVVAILILGAALLFGVALYQGTTSIPEAVITQIWVTFAALLTVGSTAIAAWFNAHNVARIRDEAARNAQFIQEAAAREAAIGRQRSDENAEKTQVKVQETQEQVSGLITRVEDGLGEKMADIVKVNQEKVAEDLRKKQNEEKIAALLMKVDALLSSRPAETLAPVALAPVAPAVTSAAVDAGIQAVQENTQSNELVAEQLSKLSENSAAVREQTDATAENSSEISRNTEARRQEGDAKR